MSLCESILELNLQTEKQILAMSGIKSISDMMLGPILRAAQLGRSKQPTLLLSERFLEIDAFVKLLANDRKEPIRFLNCQALANDVGKFNTELFQNWNYSHGGIADNMISGVVCLEWIDTLDTNAQLGVVALMDQAQREDDKDIKIVVTASPNFKKLFHEGKIEPRLYYRLNFPHIEIPPIRSRCFSDIPARIEAYRQEMFNNSGITRAFPEATIKEMCQFTWPMNLLGLEHAVHSLIIHGAPDSEVTREELYNDDVCCEEWIGEREPIVGNNFVPPKRTKSKRSRFT